MADLFDQAYDSVGTGSRDRVDSFNNKTKPEPVTPDEEQDIVVERTITVMVNGKNYTITDDDGELEIRRKLDGSGIHFGKDGDIMMLTGSGGNGKACGGRFLVNAKGGGLFKYDGPQITVATADSQNAAEGEGSTESTEETSNAGKGQLACSNLYYGDAITECHGEVRIKGTNIVIEAADVLTLMGKNSVHIQAGPSGGGEIKLAAGQISETTDTRISQVTGQKQDVISEELSLQYDPRASVNVISPGHMNVKAAGDIALGCAGAIEMIALGKKTFFGLIKDPVATISMKTVAGGLTLTSASFTDISSGAFTQNSAVTTVNVGKYVLTSAEGIDVNAVLGDVKVTAEAGGVEVTAEKGNVKLKGTQIYLN